VQRYFLDCEYNGYNGALLSLALVPADGGEEFYVTLTCDVPLNDWVQRHVVPYLDQVPVGLQSPRLGHEQAAMMLSAWLAGLSEAEILADWPEDISLFCRLLMVGNAQIVPVPSLTFRLLRLPGFSTAANSAVPHNALHDARSLRDHVITHLE
jgi:hypothetical protein